MMQVYPAWVVCKLPTAGKWKTLSFTEQKHAELAYEAAKLDPDVGMVLLSHRPHLGSTKVILSWKRE